MKWLALHLMVLLLSPHVFARGTAGLLNDTSAQELLAKKCIRLGTSEVLPIQFETACQVLAQPHLLEAAQGEYSTGGEVGIPIIETAPGHYYYISETGHRTEMVELYRKQTDACSFDYIVKASGKRFFGRYDVVVHLQVIDAATAGVVYSVRVHAYAHNGVSRFLARRLGVTNRYFKKKTQLISYVARETGLGLCEREEIKLNGPQGNRATPYGLNPELFSGITYPP